MYKEIQFRVNAEVYVDGGDLMYVKYNSGVIKGIPVGNVKIYSLDPNLTQFKFLNNSAKHVTVTAPLLTTAEDICRSMYDLESFNFTGINKISSFKNSWRGCNNMTSWHQDYIGDAADFEGTWYNCTKMETYEFLYTTSGTNFKNTFYNNTSLKCLTGIDTRNQTDCTDILYGCDTFRPNLDEIDDIKAGTLWTNSDNCPSYSLGIVYDDSNINSSFLGD